MGWWFGRKSAPADVRPFVPAWLGTAEEQGFARSYELQFDEVYRRNPVGQRAVRLVAGMLGALPVYAAEGNANAVAPIEGMTMYVRSSTETASYRNGGWELGALRGSRLVIGGDQVVGGQTAAIAEPSGGTQVDAEARSAIGAILAALRQHGLIAS